MQTQLDFMMKEMEALSSTSVESNLRLTEYETYQVAEYGRDMVDHMIRRVEDAFNYSADLN